MNNAQKKRLVIVGTGWGGFDLLRRLEQRQKWDQSSSFSSCTVISPRNYFVFTPLLASTTVGTLEYRAIVESVRSVIRNPEVTSFIQTRVTDIDLDRNLVMTESTDPYLSAPHQHTVPFDTLVIACGAVSNTFNTPGVTTHGYFLKDIEDARRIRRNILDCFDKALEDAPNLDHLVSFAIVGGGPTGVEFAAELHDFVSQDLSK